MRRIKIYLDTSVVNYLDAPHMPRQMQDTLALWDVFIAGNHFDVVISEVLEREVLACPLLKRSVLVNKMAEIQYVLIRRTQEILDLTDHYTITQNDCKKIYNHFEACAFEA